MSRSQLMSWVMSAVVHTGMFVVLGSALTAFQVLAPEVPGNRIVVMSSMADVASPASELRETMPVAPVQVAELADDSSSTREDVEEPPEVDESPAELSPQPLELTSAAHWASATTRQSLRKPWPR